MKLASLAFLLVIAPTLSAQSTLRGIVTTADSTPLRAVHVLLVDSLGTMQYEVLTNAAGEFEFNLTDDAPAGVYYLTASHIGYTRVQRAAIRIGADEAVAVRVRMHADAVLIDPIQVVARSQRESPLMEDYRRRAARIKRTGFGRLIEYDQLQRAAGLSFSRVVSSRVAGVQMEQVRNATGFVVETLTTRGGCRPAVLLDRLPVSDLDMINVASLEGVEVYRDITEVPAEFTFFGNDCGLILAWTGERPGKPLTLRRIAAFLGLVGWTIWMTQY